MNLPFSLVLFLSNLKTEGLGKSIKFPRSKIAISTSYRLISMMANATSTKKAIQKSLSNVVYIHELGSNNVYSVQCQPKHTKTVIYYTIRKCAHYNDNQEKEI